MRTRIYVHGVYVRMNACVHALINRRSPFGTRGQATDSACSREKRGIQHAPPVEEVSLQRLPSPRRKKCSHVRIVAVYNLCYNNDKDSCVKELPQGLQGNDLDDSLHLHKHTTKQTCMKCRTQNIACRTRLFSKGHERKRDA